MKKHVIGPLLWISISAHAQSAVTLYGVVDDAIAFNSNANGNHQYFLSSGTEGANRWGLKGTEDLGGGLQALFVLENGFSNNTGAIGNGGAIFGRASYVGLSGNAGTLTLGRQFSPGVLYVWPIAANSWAFSGAGYGAHPGDVDNLDSSRWVNNAVIYTTPTISGFTGQAMYALGNLAGSMAEHRIMAVGGRYVNGPVQLGIGYQVANQPNFSFYGNMPSSSSTGNNMWSPVNEGFASAGAQKIFALSAAYTIGNATVGAVYSNTRYTDLGGTAVTGLTAEEASYRGAETFNVGEVNFKYQLTPALLLGAAYSYTGSSGVNAARYQQVTLAFDYSISKQTYVYGGAIYQHAEGTNSLGLPAVAQIGGGIASSSNEQTVAVFGLGHIF